MESIDAKERDFTVNYHLEDWIATGASYFGKFKDDEIHNNMGGVQMDRHYVDVDDDWAIENTYY